MKLLVVIYLIVGLLFAVKTEFLESLLELGISQHKFWVVLTFSMMCMLSALAYFSHKSQKKEYLIVHLISKWVSTVSFLILFILYPMTYAYLVGVMVDGFIAVSLVYFYRTLYV